MILVDFRTILNEKYLRQKNIPNLILHANGFASHIGKISPGCEGCFTEKACRKSIFIGNKCPFQCPMCYYTTLHNNTDESKSIEKDIINTNEFYYSKLFDENYSPSNICYNSIGEPFLYLEHYLSTSKIIKQIETKRNINIHKRIYTTGILYDMNNTQILKDLDIEEIRFHISASDFSIKVYNNMEHAAKNGFRVTVEEPSWMLNRDKLFEAIKLFDSIGVKHLNLDEIDITPMNIQKVNSIYPEGRMYKNLNYHLYDEGLVYDIMEEVINKNYKFSVLDCNSDTVRARYIVNRNEVLDDENDFKNMVDKEKK